MKSLLFLRPLVCLFFLSLFVVVNSLEAQSTFSEMANKNYQLELDVKNAFSGLGSATMMFKTISSNKDDLATGEAIKLKRYLLRLDFSENLTHDFTTDTIDSNRHPTDFTRVVVGFGLEKQIKKGAFVHYYGMDLLLSYINDKGNVSYSRSPSLVPVTQSISGNQISSAGVGVNPFFGIKYYFSNQLSIGVETGFLFSGLRTRVKQFRTVSTIENGNLIEVRNNEGIVYSNALTAQFNNLRFLTIGYVF